MPQCRVINVANQPRSKVLRICHGASALVFERVPALNVVQPRSCKPRALAAIEKSLYTISMSFFSQNSLKTRMDIAYCL
jgi:hypothetical protein